MQYCPKCNMNIRGTADKCPLCNSATVATDNEGNDYGGVFPVIPTILRRYNFILRVVLFISVVASVITLCVNLMIPHKTLWSLYVMLGCGCLCLTLFTALLRRNNIQRSIMNLTLVLTALSPVVDLLIGWIGWSVSYVVPILFSLCSIMIIITAFIMKTDFSQVVMYLIISCLFGLAPVLFLSLGWADVIYPGYISIIVSGIIIAALLILFTNRLFTEFRRRLHM